MDNFKQRIKTKVQDISSKDLSIDFAEPKVILVQSIIRQMIRMVVDIIEKDLSSAQPEQRWIPCSEKLPEKEVVYIITVHYDDRNFIAFDNFCSYKHGWKEWSNQEVLAWMPLPEPYRGEQK